MKRLLAILLRLSRPHREGHLYHADGSTYMERFVLFESRWLSARLHHIVTPDFDRDMHDHPWNFVSVVLAGGYIEARPLRIEPSWDGETELRRGHYRRPLSIVFRRATDRHLISYIEPETWSLFINGPKRQWWGFYTRAGKVHWTEYASIHGDPRSPRCLGEFRWGEEPLTLGGPT